MGNARYLCDDNAMAREMIRTAERFTSIQSLANSSKGLMKYLLKSQVCPISVALSTATASKRDDV